MAAGKALRVNHRVIELALEGNLPRPFASCSMKRGSGKFRLGEFVRIVIESASLSSFVEDEGVLAWVCLRLARVVLRRRRSIRLRFRRAAFLVGGLCAAAQIAALKLKSAAIIRRVNNSVVASLEFYRDEF